MPNALNHFDLARNFAAQGKENEAFKYFGKVLETDPGHAETYRAIGQIYAGKKEYESAIQNYRRAVALDSTSGALNDMGLSFQLAGQLDSALVIFKKTVEGSSRSPVSLVNLANILSLQREYKSAITYYRQAISLSPNYFKAWYNCALAHRELGEEKESAYCYQQAMRFQNSRY